MNNSARTNLSNIADQLENALAEIDVSKSFQLVFVNKTANKLISRTDMNKVYALRIASAISCDVNEIVEDEDMPIIDRLADVFAGVISEIFNELDGDNIPVEAMENFARQMTIKG